jgi:hypothetical protein
LALEDWLLRRQTERFAKQSHSLRGLGHFELTRTKFSASASKAWLQITHQRNVTNSHTRRNLSVAGLTVP